MPKIKEKDFIELEYTGKLKEGSIIFDTTNEQIAKQNKLFNENAEYSPIVICVGQGQIIKGLDKALIDKETEKPYTIEVKAEDAYGKKNAKLIQLISTAKFQKQGIQPIAGLQVNIDGMLGIVKAVSGGRTLVDFNHPLAGKELIYEIKIKRIITDLKEKTKSILNTSLGIKDAIVTIENNKVTINTEQEIPKEFQQELKNKIQELINIGNITIQKSEKKQEDLNTSNPTNELKGGKSGISN